MSWVWLVIFGLGILLMVTVTLLVRSLEKPRPPKPSPEKPLPEEKPLLGKARKGSLELTLFLPKEKYTLKENIPVQLTLVNRGETVQTLSFSDAQRFDLWAEDLSGKRIWRWSSGMAFAQVLGEEVLGPGEKLAYKLSWDPPPLPGRYVIWGIIGKESKVQAGPVKVVVEITIEK